MGIRETAQCAEHGSELKREKCKACNAIYMRAYQRRRRAEHPDLALIDRARERARRKGLAFSLRREEVRIPARCPALGIPLRSGGGRNGLSPSLDRLVPDRGYIASNVRVLSDRANQLKGNRTLDDLRQRATTAPRALRSEYRSISEYVERELFLEEIRRKAQSGGRAGAEWARLAKFLERRFQQINEGANVSNRDVLGLES